MENEFEVRSNLSGLAFVTMFQVIDYRSTLLDLSGRPPYGFDFSFPIAVDLAR